MKGYSVCRVPNNMLGSGEKKKPQANQLIIYEDIATNIS